jgi:hypothetical protein
MFIVVVASRVRLVTMRHGRCPRRQPAAFRWGKVKRQAGGGHGALVAVESDRWFPSHTSDDLG